MTRPEEWSGEARTFGAIAVVAFVMLGISVHLWVLLLLAGHPWWAAWCLLWGAFWDAFLHVGARDWSGS